MTNSRCNDANSGSASNTVFRNRKSPAASFPERPPSLETEPALDVDGREADSIGLGVEGREMWWVAEGVDDIIS
jgi:hypothetical protein